MRKHLLSLLLLLPLMANAVTFQPDTLYSRWVINSCLYHFNANTMPAGFARYDANGTEIQASESLRGFDYVPGLVAKAVLEAVDYYQNQPFAAPWFHSICAYGNQWAASVPDAGGSLDNLNAAKLYFGLQQLAQPGSPFAQEELVHTSHSAITRAAQALADHHNRFAISEETSRQYCGDTTFAGGWWHKANYVNEMWCDGQYMGPALLAQMINHGITLPGLSEEQCWDIVYRQFSMTWLKLWNPETRLLYHAFSASPQDDPFWADQQAGSHYGVSAEYWGRATGWYFLALVDVLEQMPVSNPHYSTLRTMLNQLADGLAARQDSATGCWRQLLQYGATVFQPEDNYLESSCSAIFIASYLKGMRLGLYDINYYPLAEKAYKGFVETFIQNEVAGPETDGNELILTHNCASAGLSATRKGDAAYYLDQTKDTKRVDTYTEGKVLGAFVLAAVEYERAVAQGIIANHTALKNAGKKSGMKKRVKNGVVLIEQETRTYTTTAARVK